ncbi:proline-rich protein 12-like [Amblyraja radiata]|uniref:proline-rich protein 12-like n=1 Tax=Amblyraja radiata TaxID=386614 RepID=UPI0014023124|nr:proline-rich protein 12-like [Amblyraja radiata]
MGAPQHTPAGTLRDSALLPCPPPPAATITYRPRQPVLPAPLRRSLPSLPRRPADAPPSKVPAPGADAKGARPMGLGVTMATAACTGHGRRGLGLSADVGAFHLGSGAPPSDPDNMDEQAPANKRPMTSAEKMRRLRAKRKQQDFLLRRVNEWKHYARNTYKK